MADDRRLTATARNDGFTLLEITVSTVILVMVFLITWETFAQLTQSTLLDLSSNELDASLRRTLNLVSEEAAESGQDVLGVDRVYSHLKGPDRTELDFIQFDRRLSFTGDPVADWSSMITFRLVELPGEDPGNGGDDDNDGLVDEQQLVRIQDGVPDRIVLHNIQDIKFTREPWTNFITVEATVQRNIQGSDEQMTFTRQLTRTFALRNRN